MMTGVMMGMMFGGMAMAAGIPVSEHGIQIPNTVVEFDESLTAAGGTDESLIVAIKNYLDFFLGFVAVLLLIAVLFGGWKYLTASGDAEQAKEGTNTIMLAVVGLVIVLVSFAAVNLLVKGLVKGSVVL